MDAMAFDRGVEDLGNSVELGHVNLLVPDQKLATAFYVSGLGFTRDPFLMTGIDNMWINIGRGQFHLPSGNAQKLRGTTGLVVPDLDQLLWRLDRQRQVLAGTQFGFSRGNDGVEVTCPWGNKLRCHAPDAERFGRITLGMPYVEFDVAPGTLDGIARFYNEIMDMPATVLRDAAETRVVVADGATLRFKETSAPLPDFDGHHIQITLVDFSGPYRKLLDRGLVTREDDQHQWRFQDIVDLDTGRVLFTVEHEVRSLKHPMFGRPLLNRNPNTTNRNYMAGFDSLQWAMPPE